MTRELYNHLVMSRDMRGIIVIEKFDKKVEEYLQKFEILSKTKNIWTVSNEEKIFHVFIPNDINTLGKRCGHLIIDARLSDDILLECVFPMLVNSTYRKVEVF